MSLTSQNSKERVILGLMTYGKSLQSNNFSGINAHW